MLIIIFILCYIININGEYIPYNAHSFDDIGMWDQLLLKNVKYIKVDIQYASKNACETYSSWNSSLNKCYNDNNNNELCCLALRGDVSTIPDLPAPFNTTYDFLNWINEHSTILMNYNPPLRFQLDFCTGMHENEPIGILFQDFMNKLQQIIKPLNGIETPGYLGYDPFAINMEIDDIPNHCKVGNSWPQSDVCYMFYEPSTQKDLDTTMNTLFSSSNCPSLPSKHRNVLPGGSCFTCNLEQEMFEVYSSSYIKSGNQTSLYINATNGIHDTIDNYMILAYTLIDGTKMLDILQLPNGNKLTSSIVINGLKSDVQSIYASKSGTVSLYYIHIIDQQGHLLIYGFDTTHNIVKLIQSYNLNQSINSITLLTNSTMNYELLQSVSISTKKQCAIETHIYSLKFNGEISSIYNNCILPSNVINTTTITNVSISMTTSSSLYEGLVTFSTFENVYALYLSVSYVNSKVNMSIIGNNSPKRLDFGTSSHVKVVTLPSNNNNNKDIFVIESHTNGMCQNGLAINNGDDNHCEIPLGKVAGLSNVNGLLNYNWGKLNHFKNAIENGRPLLGGCDPYIIHAKYDSGYNPSISVYINNITKKVHVSEIHLGNQSPGGLLGVCGMSKPSKGIIFDSWSLVQPSQLP